MFAVIRHTRRAFGAARIQAEAEAQARDPGLPEPRAQSERDRAAEAQGEARVAAVAALVAGLLCLWALLSLRSGLFGLCRAGAWDLYASTAGLAPADLAGPLRSAAQKRADAWSAIGWGAVLLLGVEGPGLAGALRKSRALRHDGGRHLQPD